jgi:mRNA interferase HicA
VKRKDLIPHLKTHGRELIREGAKHSWWGNPANRRRSSIPRHIEIDEHLARKICRDLVIPEPSP